MSDGPYDEYLVLREAVVKLDATPKPFISAFGSVCYQTLYKDGWRQPDWCAKHIFETEAKSKKALSFGLALELLQTGNTTAIWRKAWDNLGSVLEYHSAAVFMRRPSDRIATPWVPTEEDLVSNDWVCR